MTNIIHHFIMKAKRAVYLCCSLTIFICLYSHVYILLSQVDYVYNQRKSKTNCTEIR